MVTDPNHGFPARLAEKLSQRAPIPLTDEGARHASVAIVVAAGPAPALLFVKRLEREGDPWSGHAAFPGGFRSGLGEHPVVTAQRETQEETGLDLATAGTLLGQLDDVYPRSVHLPRVIVTPCVFSVPGQLPVHAAGEIDRALWVPVVEVFDDANRRPFSLDLPGEVREFESIHVSGLIVWGLTERILQQIVTMLQ